MNGLAQSQGSHSLRPFLDSPEHLTTWKCRLWGGFDVLQVCCDLASNLQIKDPLWLLLFLLSLETIVYNCI